MVSSVASLVAAGDEIAERDELAADAAADRRADLAELQVERRRPGRCAAARSMAAAAALRSSARESRSRCGDRVALEQLLRPLEVALGELEPRARAGERGAGLVERRAVGARVDDEQQITLA